MKTIRLTQAAYLNGGVDVKIGGIYVLFWADESYYTAHAEDQEGNEYRVYWKIREEYDPECGDESMACDWDTPKAIIALDDNNKDVTDEIGTILDADQPFEDLEMANHNATNEISDSSSDRVVLTDGEAEDCEMEL